ncbi:putative phage protein [Brachyspira pilosicoli WesB]|uniref:Putative phage protein n=1 Tax=Brachyspira pilosicoli WesB TaxID=1161918 RepID=K0JGC2_BRAPL|nr:phage tail tape measure protein [Brachyspira pilosicoli]CCG55807.1 putative phage protein [Brachyspira pilosicoli WesB]
MANIQAGVLIKLNDRFSSGIDKASNKVDAFSSKMKGAFSKIDGILNSTASNLAALGVSIGVGATINKMIAFEDRINKLGTIAKQNAKDTETYKKQMEGLSDAIYKAAMQPDIKIDANEIVDAMNQIMEKTGDMDFARSNIENIGRAMRAFDVTGADIGSMMSEFSKLGYTSKEVSKLMDEMYVQGNKGAFTAAEFAKNGAAIISAYSKIGTSSENIKNANAAMQILTMGVKSPTDAVTTLESIMSELGNPKKQEELRKLGERLGVDLNVRDANGNFKDLNEILLKIVSTKDKLGGNLDEYGLIFGDVARRAIAAYDTYGNKVDNMLDVSEASGEMIKAAKKNALSMKANIQNLQTAFDAFANSNLAPILQKITDILNRFAENPERFERVFKVLTAGFGIFMGAKLVSGIANTILSLRTIGGTIKGISTSMIPQPLAQGLSTNPIPVFVTNMGQGFSNANNSNYTSSNINNINNKKISMRSLGKTAGAGAMGAAITAIPMAVSGFMAANDPSLSKKEQNKRKGEAIGGAVGSIAGTALGASAGAATTAAIGAAIGSVVPGLGTAIGALVGAGVGIAGGYLGNKLGGKIGESLTKEETMSTVSEAIKNQEPPKVEMKGNANIGLEIKLTDSRTYMQTNQINNIPNLNINTGHYKYINGVS